MFTFFAEFKPSWPSSKKNFSIQAKAWRNRTFTVTLQGRKMG
jgi:hypothetical protein